MKFTQLIISTLSGLLLVAATSNALASESVPSLDETFDVVQFERDVKNTLTAATRLNALCTTEKNQSYCDQAESIMRVLRAYALTNPSGLKASDDNDKYLKLINPAYLDALEKALNTGSK